MNLELTDEQLALRDTVRRMLAEKADLATHVRPLLDDPTGTTDEVWRALAGIGALGIMVPADYGGAGATMVEAGVVAEQLGTALHPGPWLSSAVAVPRALMRTGGEHAAAGLLGSIADGSTTAALGGLHGPRPHVGMRGDDAVLHGTIGPVPDAAAADTLVTVAENDSGAAIFAVDSASPGVSVTARTHVDPTRKLFDVTLDGVPARRLTAASDDALRAVLDDVLIAYAADALGAAQAVLDLAVDYAKVRRQFDKPIGSFQAVQHLCVDMYETVELARSGVIHALWAADAAEPGERHLAAVRARAFAGRLATVGDVAIQVFGGIGFTWEHDAHLYLKRLLGFSALFGGCDEYLEEVGRQLVSSVTRTERGGDRE